MIAATAKSLQSCPTLCDPIDGSLPGSPIPGILQQEHWSGLPFPSPGVYTSEGYFQAKDGIFKDSNFLISNNPLYE